MKKILLIDDSDTYTWCLQKYLQHRGYPVKTACTLKEARAAIQEEMPLVVCCNLDLPDGSGMDFLNEVRAADKELPFILASCHDKDDYEQEAMRRGATLCMDKMKGLLLQDKLVEYAYRQLSGEKAPTFHKLLFVHAEDTNAGVLRAAMLQKGFDLILVPSIADAKRRIFEDKETDLILCDLELPDGTAMELFHTLRRVAGMFHKVSGAISGDSFSVLIQKNEQERIQKSERLDSLLAGERKAQQDIANIHQWAGTIRQYLDLQELNREIIEELIDRIEVGERTIIDGQRHQDIKIYYRFVGLV